MPRFPGARTVCHISLPSCAVSPPPPFPLLCVPVTGIFDHHHPPLPTCPPRTTELRIHVGPPFRGVAPPVVAHTCLFSSPLPLSFAPRHGCVAGQSIHWVPIQLRLSIYAIAQPLPIHTKADLFALLQPFSDLDLSRRCPIPSIPYFFLRQNYSRFGPNSVSSKGRKPESRLHVT